MDAIKMIKERRSIRKYKEEIVSRDIIEKIMDATRYTQSWANSQTARFTFVTNEEQIKKLTTDGVKGFAYNINTLKKAKNAVVLSFVKGKSGVLDDTSYEGNKWEIFDAGIACQTFCLSAHAYGVGTCVMGVIDSENIAKIINLPENETVASLITYGYIDEQPQEPKRKEVCELIKYID